MGPPSKAPEPLDHPNPNRAPSSAPQTDMGQTPHGQVYGCVTAVYGASVTVLGGVLQALGEMTASCKAEGHRSELQVRAVTLLAGPTAWTGPVSSRGSSVQLSRCSILRQCQASLHQPSAHGGGGSSNGGQDCGTGGPARGSAEAMCPSGTPGGPGGAGAMATKATLSLVRGQAGAHAW